MTEQSGPSEDEASQENSVDDETVLVGSNEADSQSEQHTLNSESTGVCQKNPNWKNLMCNPPIGLSMTVWTKSRMSPPSMLMMIHSFWM